MKINYRTKNNFVLLKIENMKNTRKIDFSKLIKQTLEVLHTEKVNPDDIIECSARGENNFWGKLCFKFFGTYSLKDSMYLYTAWKRDVSSYKTKVIQENQLKRQKTFSFEFSNDEQKLFHSMITNFRNERKSFNSDFSTFLTQKIRILGSNCLLKCEYNWFRKENSRKYGDFWSGKYSCSICNKTFKMRWIREDLNTIIFEGILSNDHSIEALKKVNHIRGEKRKALAHEIVAKGISGFRIENSSSGCKKYLTHLPKLPFK